MDNIPTYKILERSSCLERDNYEDRYNKSYYYFVNYFSDKEVLNEQDLILGANFTYGWMPTILHFKSDDFSKAVAILNDAKRPERISDEKLQILKELVNNSLVAVSKLLHFVNPEVYAIWDSRVCYLLTGKSHKQKVEKFDLFWSYLDLCERVASDPAFAAIHERHIKKMGFEITPMRTIEQIMFISSTEPLEQ